jgi:hypothetical protein
LATNRYTASYTLDSVRRRGLIPSSGKLTEDDLLNFVNDATQDYIVPLLMSSREGFLIDSEDTTLVSGQTEYPFPARAASERLYRVLLVDNASNEYPLTRIETPRRSDKLPGFEIIDNMIVLRELTAGYNTLRVEFYAMPNRLVLLAAAAKVVSTTSTTVTVDAVPSTFSTSEPLDFVQGTPGFRCRAQSKTPSNIASTTLTFAAADIPSTLAVGDYLALAGETPIAQVPVTLRPLLEQRAVCLALDALGDKRLKSAQTTLMDMEKRIMPTLSPRVPGAPRVIVNRYAPGYGRQRSGSGVVIISSSSTDFGVLY